MNDEIPGSTLVTLEFNPDDLGRYREWYEEMKERLFSSFGVPPYLLMGGNHSSCIADPERVMVVETGQDFSQFPADGGE